MNKEPQQTQIELEKIDFVYSGLFVGLIFHVLVAGGLVVVLYDVSGLRPSLTWYVIFLCIAIMRLMLLFFYKRAKEVSSNYKTWRLLYIVGAVLTGLAWGGGGVFLFPEEAIAQQIFLGFIIGGMVMGAVPFLAPLYPSYLLFNLTAELPYIFYLFTYTDKLHIVLAISHALFGISMLMAARSTQRSFLQHLMLRLINQDLAKQLNNTNRELEKKIELKDRVERDLRENEFRFKALADATHDGVIIHKESMVIDVNKAMADMLGYTESDLLGMRLPELTAAECYEDVVQRLRHPGDEPFETIGLRKDGTTFRAELRAGDVLYHGERVRIVSVRDISRQKQIEADLLHAKHAAEEADRLKSEFIASVSHELRTPLNGIIGFMEILRGTELSDEQRQYLQLGGKSADQLLLLINDLLDLSRIESGYFEYVLQATDLNKTLHEVIQIMSVNARGHHNQLHLQLSDDLPAWISIDPKRMKQVLINLVGNAIKFTEAGHVTVTVTASPAEGEKVLLRFEVKDEGIGIPEDKQRLIFRRFTQVDAGITRRYGGTGLGLAISQELVHKMGGEIGVHSILGEGATFWFTLPCEVISPPQQIGQMDEGIHDTEPGKGLNVLVVEDEQTNRIIARTLLETLGCRVALAENGRQAVEQDETYDLIFMDMQMPVLDGLAATALLREKGVTVPIIAMTANAQQCDRERCHAAGMSDHLSKPISREGLRALLSQWGQQRN